MKQILLNFLVLSSLLLFMSSCNDDDDDGNGGPTPVTYTFKGNIEYPIEGDPVEEWSSVNVKATLKLDGTFEIIATLGGDSLVITTFGFQEFISYETDTLLNNLIDENYFVRSNGVRYGIVPASQRRFSQVLYNSIDYQNEVINMATFNVVFEEVDPMFGGIPDLMTLTDGEILDLPYETEVSDNPGGGFNDDFVTYTLDGSEVTFETFITQSAGGLVTASASADLGSLPMLTMIFNESLGTGTYDLAGQTGISFTFTTGVNIEQIFTNNSGELVITSNSNGIIEGTFNFTGTNSDNSDTVELTNGSFSIEF